MQDIYKNESAMSPTRQIETVAVRQGGQKQSTRTSVFPNDPPLYIIYAAIGQ